MLDFRFLIRTIVILAMFLLAAALHAQEGLRDAFARVNFSGELSNGLLGSSVVAADFNHDSHPDGAILVHNRNTFRIEVHFRFQQVNQITFASNLLALTISAVDVNHDGSADLVVVDPFSHHRLFVWLNDGYGSFRAARVDDFPVGSDQQPGLFNRQFQRPESRALVVSSKTRIRQDSPASFQLASSRIFAGFKSNVNLNGSAFISASQFLRGPPLPYPSEQGNQEAPLDPSSGITSRLQFQSSMRNC